MCEHSRPPYENIPKLVASKFLRKNAKQSSPVTVRAVYINIEIEGRIT